MSETIIKPDPYTRNVAGIIKDSFVNPDFRLTMRFSRLEGLEEFDNAQAWSRWRFLFETGISQMKQKVDELKALILTEKEKIPVDQLTNIQELITQYGKYDESLPVDDPENLKIIRKHLRPYNYCLGYGAIMYDMHYALLNGRYAFRGQGRKDVLELTKAGLEREHEVQTGHSGWKFWEKQDKE